jgi:hypothetical protein
VATTSSGRSRRLSVGLAGAVAITATALVRLTDPGTGSAIDRPPRVVSTLTPRAPPATVSPRVAPRAPSMTADELERALAQAPRGTADLVIDRDLTVWTTDDPAAAAAFALGQTDPFLREVALRTVAQRWAQTDATAAARWAESLADADERDRALAHVALSIADRNPRAALDLLARRTGDPQSDAASVGVITSWARRDFDAAQAWVEAQPPGPTRDEIVERLVVLRSYDDPHAAMSFAERLIADEEPRRDAWAAVSQRWAARDPGLVREWAISADAGTRRRIEAELAGPAPPGRTNYLPGRRRARSADAFVIPAGSSADLRSISNMRGPREMPWFSGIACSHCLRCRIAMVRITPDAGVARRAAISGTVSPAGCAASSSMISSALSSGSGSRGSRSVRRRRVGDRPRITAGSSLRAAAPVVPATWHPGLRRRALPNLRSPRARAAPPATAARPCA